jgi:hypothetical protein
MFEDPRTTVAPVTLSQTIMNSHRYICAQVRPYLQEGLGGYEPARALRAPA